jgi:glycerol-3-phosphate dehydrogenase
MALARISESSDGSHAVELRDEFSKRTVQVKPRLIMNCAGAWIDTVRHLAGLSGELVTRSRGTHLIVDRIAEDPLLFSAPEKGRVFFVLPVGSGASVIGTTDILERGDPDASRPAQEECQALLQLLKRFFPDKTPAVRSLYWGVRPLFKQEGHVSDASREHKLVREKKSFWSLPGVKLTAGRAAGEEAARAAYAFLTNKTAVPVHLGILPGADREARLRDWLEKHPEDRIPVVPEESWQIGEAGFCASEEMALTLNDFLWRRVKWPLYRDISDVSLRRLAQSMGRVLGWGEDPMELQLQDFQRVLKQHRIEQPS